MASIAGVWAAPDGRDMVCGAGATMDERALTAPKRGERMMDAMKDAAQGNAGGASDPRPTAPDAAADAAAQPPTGPRRLAGHVAVAVAVLLQLVAGWFTLTSGLMVPLYGILMLAAVWFAAAWLLARTARRRPLLTPLIPVANGLFWLAFVSAGGAWLGWTP